MMRLLPLLLPLGFLAIPALLRAQSDMYRNTGGLIENRGQWPAPVTFRASTADATIWCERGSVVIDRYDAAAIERLHAPGTAHYDPDASRTIRHHALRLRFLDARTPERSEGLGVRPGAYHYFIGNDPSRWASNAHAFTAVLQRGILPGVDLRLRCGTEAVKYDLLVAPGTDPQRIRFTYEGADGMALRGDKLVIATALGPLTEAIPLAYQEKDGRRVPVDCRYALKGRVASFVLGAYDPALELVIDPTLAFSSYSGSTSNNFGYTASFDDEGFLYAGSSAFGQGYPTTMGAYDTSWNGGDGNGNAGTDIALSKFDTTGTHLIWSTFLGGDGDDLPHSLIVDPTGELVVLGTTGSPDFPTTPGAFDASFGGGTPFQPDGLGTAYPNGLDMIVARLDANGATLLGSTYIGGSANDGINSAPGLKFNYADEIRGEVLLDPQGNILVASTTQSSDFPVTAGAYRTTFSGGSHDAVLMKLDPLLSSVTWSTFFGGTAADAAYAMEVDQEGAIYITGGTASPDLPTTAGAIAGTFQGGPADAFVAAFSADGAALQACTYYGSDAYDQSYFVEMDDADNVYLFGQTKALAGALIANAPYFVNNGGQLLAKLSHDLTMTLWSSRFGSNTSAPAGVPNISPTAFLVDYCDKIYISGWGSITLPGSTLTTTGLPHTPDAYQPTTDGNDFYLAVFDIDMQGAGPLYATFFGGTQSPEHVDGGTSRFDRRGRVYQAVCAGCQNHDDFPTTPGALSATNNSTGCNLAVFKFDFEAPLVIAGLAAPDLLCADAPIQFTDMSNLAASYLWDFGDTHTSTEAAPQHTYALPGTYTVTLTVTNDATCNAQDAASIQVTVLGKAPDLQAMDDVSLCGPAASLLLTATSHGEADTYHWSTSPAFTDMLNATPQDSTALLMPPVAGTYYIQASKPGHCNATDQVVVSTSLIAAALSPDVALCADETATLTLSGIDPGSTITWSPADSVDAGQGTVQVIVSPAASTEFHVDVLSPSGCAWGDDVLVTISEMNGSSVNATVEPEIVLAGTTVQLHATPGTGVSYSWTPPGAVSDPSIADPTAYVTQSTTFYVTVTDGTCSRMDSVKVRVHELRCEEPDIFIPDAFTPNGDGNNDLLLVRGRHIRDLDLKVFDRWGEVVFATTDPAKGWDATYKGKPVDPAVYVYWLTVHCVDGQAFFTKGNVTVIR